MNGEHRLIVNVSKQNLQSCLTNSLEAELRTLGFLKPSETLEDILASNLPDVIDLELVLKKEVTTRLENGKEQ
jgi:hypothetical protein